ncbi:hypothetical protein Tco_1459940, partial [Tanacetum coccineum]
YNSTYVGVSFRLGGETRTMSLMELGWRVGLYSERESRMDETRRELNKRETVKTNIVTMGFWPTIGDGDFFVRIRLVHHCIATTISGRKESTHRVTAMDLFFLYCIYGEGVTCNIPYWDALHVKPKAHVFKKRSLITMGVVMDIGGGTCCCSATRQVREEDEVEETANEEAGGSAEGTEI